MLQIVPAVLQYEMSDFKRELLKLSLSSVLHVDIVKNFTNSKDSIEIATVLKMDEIKLFNEICFHLMSNTFPAEEIEMIKNFTKQNPTRYFSVAISQDLLTVETLLLPENLRVVPVIENDNLFQIEFYDQFFELIIMTVEPGTQGRKFLKKRLNLVEELRSLGFNGEIALDGGINEKTITQILKVKINKLIVGSYFSKSEDFKSAFNSLADLVVDN
ncbi:hypothetical protein D6810_00205, partial [Candidatus Dojkabacteria bacterium]